MPHIVVKLHFVHRVLEVFHLSLLKYIKFIQCVICTNWCMNFAIIYSQGWMMIFMILWQEREG